MAEQDFDQDCAVSIEEDGNGCKLTISLSWDALERLFTAVADKIDPRQAAAELREQRTAARREELERRRAQFQVKAQTLYSEFFELREANVSSKDAYQALATKHSLTVPLTTDFVRMGKRAYRKIVDAEVLRLHEKGYSLRQIEICTGLSRTAASQTIKRSLTAPGAVGGSRASSGCRARRAGREALDATEEPPRSPQGSGREGSGNAASSLPEPLPVGETRGFGGKAPAKSREHKE